MTAHSLGKFYTDSFRENWNLPLFSDYGGNALKYSDVALKIQSLSNLLEGAGIKPGDKISIYGRNSANWGIIYLTCLAYGAVAVPILPDFKAENVHHIVNHSESKILFASKALYSSLDYSQMGNIEGVLSIENFNVISSKTPLLNEAFAKYEGSPKSINKENFKFGEFGEDDLCMISYTSGTSGFTKGVMLPNRSIYSNVLYAQEHMPLRSGHKIVSFLPMAHCYGLLFEFQFPITVGCHITFLNKMPSPQILTKAFQEIKPNLILSVPLVIEKIYKKKLLPTLKKPAIKVLLAIPGINQILYKSIRAKLIDTFGGNFCEIVIGGAALSPEVEKFFRKIHFPFTIGYGMTECGPLISYASWNTTQPSSSGILVDRMEVRIESEDPYKTVGEIQVRGENVTSGYFKNDEATKNTFTADGWLKTGDLGIIDKQNFIYIKGRSKNMLLGPSGQNIYPEELEARLSNMPYIQECVVVQRDAKLVALVYPDHDAMKSEGVTANDLEALMNLNKENYNKEVSSYEQLSKIELVDSEFEKTPKKNIKRYLYV